MVWRQIWQGPEGVTRSRPREQTARSEKHVRTWSQKRPLGNERNVPNDVEEAGTGNYNGKS